MATSQSWQPPLGSEPRLCFQEPSTRPRNFCSDFSYAGWCLLGDACVYAHGLTELHPEALAEFRAATQALAPDSEPVQSRQVVASDVNARAPAFALAPSSLSTVMVLGAPPIVGTWVYGEEGNHYAIHHLRDGSLQYTDDSSHHGPVCTLADGRHRVDVKKGSVNFGHILLTYVPEQDVIEGESMESGSASGEVWRSTATRRPQTPPGFVPRGMDVLQSTGEQILATSKVAKAAQQRLASPLSLKTVTSTHLSQLSTASDTSAGSSVSGTASPRLLPAAVSATIPATPSSSE